MSAPAMARRAARGLAAAALLTGAPAPAAAADLSLRLGGDERGGDGAGTEAEVRYRLRSPLEDPAFAVRAGPPPAKNTALAAGEVLFVNLAMWQYSYWAGADYAKISVDSIEDNFNKGWIVDTDGFWTNQFGHPYEGSLFFNAARSTGHGPYESFAVSFIGSAFWESFMETQSPSVNDQITTPFGGSVFGEVLWRMYRLIMDSAGPRPSGWRKLGALAVNPLAGVNQALTGQRYHGPTLLPTSWTGEFHFGTVIGASLTDERTGAREQDVGPWGNLAAHVTYGLPGDPELRLKAPFDHFDARIGYSFTDAVEPSASMLIRGLLVGDTLEPGDRPLGLWGLFTSYDVVSVPLFKATGFGVGPGVSLVRRWGSFELQGTAVVEFLPWAGGGSVEKLYQRDYHYGPGAKALLDVRALFGDRVILDLGAREYWVSGVYATGSSEDVTWTRAAVTSRVVGPHAVTFSVDWARRHASYPAAEDISQRGAVFLGHYTLLAGW
jgi:hypothetical protein